MQKDRTEKHCRNNGETNKSDNQKRSAAQQAPSSDTQRSQTINNKNTHSIIKLAIELQWRRKQYTSTHHTSPLQFELNKQSRRIHTVRDYNSYLSYIFGKSFFFRFLSFLVFFLCLSVRVPCFAIVARNSYVKSAWFWVIFLLFVPNIVPLSLSLSLGRTRLSFSTLRTQSMMSFRTNEFPRVFQSNTNVVLVLKS